MNICILGTGKMGSWLAKQLSAEHTVSVYDTDTAAARRVSGVRVLSGIEDIRSVAADLLLNCVSLQNTVETFRAVLPHVPKGCLLCDIASVKGSLPAFYRDAGLRFVSVHPMFGPTFADLNDLRKENAVIISDSEPEGKEFFRKLFGRFGINVFEYSFSEHDVMMAYSLTLPFVSSMVFASCVSTEAVPGTTFKHHLDVARGLLSEDDFLLSEIIFNPHSLAQLEKISGRLNFLWHIVRNRDTGEARRFFEGLRKNVNG
ncbi:MAG TPA: prephenate dehydrogenase/arogenate dehydrogenase family protein [Bacteroidota bacterium]|nr:prephenate dehydrogenase/arogenate dehydrogenase family protein [Bacteroidota bacterium]